MARERTQAKPTETDATNPPSAVQVQNSPRRTPPWRRQYLRRLAIHGEKGRAAKECKITIRQVNRTERAKPRFARAVKLAQRIALEAHAERMQAQMIKLAEEGYTVPIVSNGKVVAHARKHLPTLMKLVAEITTPMFRDARHDRDRMRQARRELHEGSVSNVTNTLNVSLSHAGAENPTVRALLLALSDELTRSRAESPIIDVTPAGEAPAAPGDDASIVVRPDDD